MKLLSILPLCFLYGVLTGYAMTNSKLNVALIVIAFGLTVILWAEMNRLAR